MSTALAIVSAFIAAVALAAMGAAWLWRRIAYAPPGNLGDDE